MISGVDRIHDPFAAMFQTCLISLHKGETSLSTFDLTASVFNRIKNIQGKGCGYIQENNVGSLNITIEPYSLLTTHNFSTRCER